MANTASSKKTKEIMERLAITASSKTPQVGDRMTIKSFINLAVLAKPWQRNVLNAVCPWKDSCTK